MEKAEFSHDSCVLKRLVLKKEDDRASWASLFNRYKISPVDEELR
ncbi:MAG: hypothetical protein Q8Q31_05270 [Nanoarchaeota archaeon]|nr:hypothetical protein [Nanoarchaeota archaeon]